MSKCDTCQCEPAPWRVTTYAPDGTVYEDHVGGMTQDWDDDNKDFHEIDDWDEEDYKPEPQLASFNAAAERTFERARAVHLQRGNEYQDSWALDNVHAPFIRHVLREVFGITDASPEQLRLLMSAALVDVKDSRMGGAFKLDTIDDGINYRAAFCSWMEEYQEGAKAQDDWDQFIASLDD